MYILRRRDGNRRYNIPSLVDLQCRIGEKDWLLVLDVVQKRSLPLKNGIGVSFISRDSIVVPVTKDSMLTIKAETSVTLFRNRSQPRNKTLSTLPFFSFQR